MHSTFYNQATIKIKLQPNTPLLIKAGGEGLAAIDPTLPDMNFVRTRRAGREPEVYIPGSSLRGVVRGYAERLLRSVKTDLACNPTQTGRGGRQTLKSACYAGTDTTKMAGAEAYNKSCYACRLFGNMAVAGRAGFGDLYVPENGAGGTTLETRYGVAIDRITGAVAQGPFEVETLTQATFAGMITVRNFTLGQLGLLAAALLDLSEGLVPLGFGKSKGFGRVEITFQRFAVRTVRDPGGKLLGAGALRKEDDDYDLPGRDKDMMPWDVPIKPVRGFHEAALEENKAIRAILEKIAGRWPEEVKA